MKILLTGGGSGGHIFPLIAVVREIRRFYPQENLEFFYLGPKDNWAKLYLAQEGVRIKTIWAGKIRRYTGAKTILENIIDLFVKLPLGTLQAFFYLLVKNPYLVFSKGGYGSVPAGVSAKVLQIPIFLHESDATPGLSNRLLGRLALKIFTSFPRTEYFKPQKMIEVGNPIRREILEGSVTRAQEVFELAGDRQTLLILGGSQGAQRINDLVLLILPELLKRFEVIHQCGEQNFDEVRNETQIVVKEDGRKYYHLAAFLRETELREAYAAADLVIGRAGAGSIFELAALAKPSILIPLSESAQGHQTENAQRYGGTGACLVLEEKNITAHFFFKRLEDLMARPERLEEMSAAAKRFSRPQAAQEIADYLMKYLIYTGSL